MAPTRMRATVTAALCLAALLGTPVTVGAASDIPAETPAALVRLAFPQGGALTPYTIELAYPLLTLVYDTLLWRDADGVPRPWLATSVEESRDGTRLTVRLDADARWHDGVALTAADVVFTISYLRERTHPRFTPQLAAIQHVEAVDPSTVVIDLAHPAPGFADQPLADMPILPAHLWEGLAADQVAPEGLAVGSGPYRLTDEREGDGWRFEAVADYFRGRPAVDTVEVTVIEDAEATFRALERREVDMLPFVLTDDMRERLSGPGVRVVDGVSYLGTVVLFNLRAPPFDQLEARQAVAAAVDPARIARFVGGTVPADRGYLHPSSTWASTQVLHEPRGQTSPAPASLDLPRIEVLAPDNDPAKAAAGRQITRALQGAGIDADLSLLARDELARAVGDDGSDPTFQLAVWHAPPLASHDPDFLGRLFGSDPQLAPFNHAGYRNPAFDELLARVNATPDPAARQQAVDEALALLAGDLPVLPLFFAEGAYAYRPAAYDGWVYVKGTGILDKRSFVEPAREHPQARPAVTPTPGPDPSPSSEGIALPVPLSPLGWVAVGLLGSAAVLALALLVRQRRPGRVSRR